MVLACPKCRGDVEVDPERLDRSKSAVCTHCRAVFKVSFNLEIQGEEPESRSYASSERISPQLNRESVLIAVDGEVTRELIRDLLLESGFKPVESSDGRDAMALLRKHRPATALIDVGLSEVLGFQLCEQIKNDQELERTVVILVASIYDKSKYKRQPDNLYGAEDYIERHQLQDELIQKIKKYQSRGSEKSPSPAQPSAAAKSQHDPVRPPQSRQAVSQERPAAAAREWQNEGRAERENLGLDLEKGPASSSRSSSGSLSSSQAGAASAMEIQSTKKPAAPESSPEHEAAKRLARIIIADIALYNKKEVQEGVQNGTFLDLLREQLSEGRRHYDSRVSKEIRDARDYFGDAIEDFIQKKKREFT
jgi:CheY-like chemotaxis protein